MSAAITAVPAPQTSSQFVGFLALEGDVTALEALDRPDDAADYFKQQFAANSKLRMAILYLDDHHEPLACDLMEDPSVCPWLSSRGVARKALGHDATALIIGYNTQSAGQLPNEARDAFDGLKQALRPLDVHVMDFISCGADGFRSMLAAGWPE